MISVIGSTGSIGTQALSVAKKHNISVKSLAARSSWELLAKRVLKPEQKPLVYTMRNMRLNLKNALFGYGVRVVSGMEGLCEIAADREIDMLVNSVVGMIGLLPTLTSIESGTDIALANKETLVAGGNLVMKLSAEKNVKIYPVDSEHSAIFQCLQGNKREQLKKIILTASGGPFSVRN